MEYTVMGLYGGSLVCYVLLRPFWQTLGPSLVDSFVVGLTLYAAGSLAVWFEGLHHSDTVMQIALTAATSGTLSASLSAIVAFRSEISTRCSWQSALKFDATRGERFAISSGLIVSIVVILVFVIAVFHNNHVRTLLVDSIAHGKGTLNEARLIVSAGIEGYFAPGYVKQFRDIFVPILCAAAILCQGSYKNKILFYTTIVVTLPAMLISGQRSVVIQFCLCFACAYFIGWRSAPGRRFVPSKSAFVICAAMVAITGAMTEMLGRVDIALSPEVPQDRATPEVPQNKAAPDIRDTLVSSGLPRPVVAVVALVHRAVIAVPRENTISYEHWGAGAPSLGSDWAKELASVRPGTRKQKQLSTELSEANGYGSLGNSPLGLPADLFYNWGVPGVVAFPALYALIFLLLDISLTMLRSPLLFASKVFLFFSIPMMYSPFLFILYGGAVTLALIVYVLLLRRGAFALIGLRVE